MVEAPVAQKQRNLQQTVDHLRAENGKRLADRATVGSDEERRLHGGVQQGWLLVVHRRSDIPGNRGNRECRATHHHTEGTRGQATAKRHQSAEDQGIDEGTRWSREQLAGGWHGEQRGLAANTLVQR